MDTKMIETGKVGDKSEGPETGSSATDVLGKDTPKASVTPRQSSAGQPGSVFRQNTVGSVSLHNVNIVSLVIDGLERLCLAQISNTLLKDYSYNEIHNRRVALGITCVQCTPVQLEILRRAGAMPVSSRRCGMITKREADRLVKSFLDDIRPPKLPDNFSFEVKHDCGWGGRGSFLPSRYNSSRAKCLKCHYCNMFFSPNKFIFHFHRTPDAKYNHPDAANFNSWRRHLMLWDPNASDELQHAWEDVKAMFNGGSRKRILSSNYNSRNHNSSSQNSSPDYAKRPKIDSDSLESHPLSPTSPPYPGQYPVFPVPNKVMPVKTMPAHPAFTLPFNYEKAPISNEQKSSMVTAWTAVPETYYPPYEMIWAKHLGLTSPEHNFASQPGMPVNKLSPNERLEVNVHGGEGSYDENRRPVTDSGESRPTGFTVMDPKAQRPHFSAFKPVINHKHNRCSSSSGLPSPNQSEHEYRSVDERSSPVSHDGLDQNTRDSQDFEVEEHVDVDTIDDSEGNIPKAISLRRSEENNNELSSSKFALVIEPEVKGAGSPLNHVKVDEEQRSTQESCDSDQSPNKSEAVQDVHEVHEEDAHSSSSSSSSCSSPETGCDVQEPDMTKSAEQQTPVQPTIWSPRNLENPKITILADRTNNTQEQLDTDKDVEAKEGKLSNLTSLTREQLQQELVQEMETRKKLEQDCKAIKETFQEQVKRELAYREEMNKQLQVVRETLCHELDQERKVRYNLQQKLKDTRLKAEVRRAPVFLLRRLQPGHLPGMRRGSRDDAGLLPDPLAETSIKQPPRMSPHTRLIVCPQPALPTLAGTHSACSG